MLILNLLLLLGVYLIRCVFWGYMVLLLCFLHCDIPFYVRLHRTAHVELKGKDPTPEMFAYRLGNLGVKDKKLSLIHI